MLEYGPPLVTLVPQKDGMSMRELLSLACLLKGQYRLPRSGDIWI